MIEQHINQVPLLARWLGYAVMLPPVTGGRANQYQEAPEDRLNSPHARSVRERHRAVLQGLPDEFTQAEVLRHVYGDAPTRQNRYQMKLTLRSMRRFKVIDKTETGYVKL